jgi:hypothetical protein
MTRFRRMIFACLIPVLGLAVSSHGEDAKIPDGFKSLFDGKDLKGWQVHGGKIEVWSADNGILFCDKGGGGWLMTEKEYGNYELMLEFKLPKMGNSGVGLRAPLKGDPAYEGMEIQLLDDANWKGLAEWQHTGSIYNVVPAKKVVNKPFGEWNKMHIVCNGTKVKIEINGETVVDANLDDYKEKHSKKHPGILRDKGHIGFQSYNFRVEFRNIWVKELK